jgi:hypothetical protein
MENAKLSHFLCSFFASQRRNEKVLGPTTFLSLFAISLHTKQEKYSLSLQFLSPISLFSISPIPNRP